MTAEPAAADQPEGRPSRATMLIYLGAITAMFMAALDMQIVVTALPTIAGEFQNLQLFGWVGSAYLLATAAVSPFYGKLGDMFGRRNVILAAIVFFLAGSFACGVATSMETLIAARVLQGVGGGGLFVSAFAVIGEIFAPRERARYQGYTAAVFTLASVLGPVAGGWLTQTVGWRWVFLINLPVGLVVLAIIATSMKSRSDPARRKIDYLGGLLMALAASVLVYWGDYALEPGGPTFLTFLLPVVGVAAIVAFLWVERRAAEPILPLRLFRNPTVALTSVITLISGMATLGLFFYLALYIQTITGLGPAIVGLLFLPASAGSMLSAMASGALIARTGHYKWYPVVGMTLGAVVMGALTLIESTTPIWQLGLVFLAFGVSLGLHMQVMMVAIQAAAPLRDIGAATGIVTQARTVGASLGLAVNGAVLTWALTREDARMPTDLATQLDDGLANFVPQTAATLPDAAREQVLSFYSAGFHSVFWFVGGIYVLLAVLTLLMKDVEIPKRF